MRGIFNHLSYLNNLRLKVLFCFKVYWFLLALAVEFNIFYNNTSKENMKTIILVGVIFVHLALVFYTIFIIKESKVQKASNSIILFLMAAVIFDIIATSCMMIGTTADKYFTTHGTLGYIGLFAMIVDAILIVRFRLKNNAETVFSKGLNLYSKIAYSWWVIAFLTGVMVVINSK